MKINDFKSALEETLIKSQYNNFGRDNYDAYRFGEKITQYQPPKGLIISFKNLIKKVTGFKKTDILKHITLSENEIRILQRTYENLNTRDKTLLVDLIAYRYLGFTKIKLSRNTKKYWQQLELAKTLADKTDTYNPNFLHFMLEKFDLNPIGFNVKMYFMYAGVAVDYLLEQYSYKINDKVIAGVKEGDTVLDIGACWGDTAFYFASKAGKTGKVYSFEFIPGNVELFKINKSFNPELSDQIEIIEHPVSNVSGQSIYYKDFGPGSEVVMQPFKGQTGSTTTISIDDFVFSKNLAKVDFIKMDIEGAEPFALKGAIETIKKFRPTLAIAIYHSMDDFVNIPNWILDLNLDYEIFIDHFTIHDEETVCFAKPKNKR